MLRKTMFLSAILTSAFGLSAAANAGSTITDKSYWPNEARRGLDRQTVTQGGPRSAYASDPSRTGFVTADAPAVSRWTYSGGPKGR
jgi:hypothetical protein